MFNHDEDSKPSSQTLSIEVEYGENQTEWIEVDPILWAKLEKAAQNHGNSIGEELAEIWNREIG